MPDGWYTVEEWARRFGLQPCAAQKALEKLEAAGKVKRARYQKPEKTGRARMKNHWKWTGNIRPEHIKRPAK